MLIDERKNEETSRGDQRPQKKPYRKPTLIRLGSLRELTKTVGKSGNWDGGLTGKNRTGRGGHHATDCIK